MVTLVTNLLPRTKGRVRVVDAGEVGVADDAVAAVVGEVVPRPVDEHVGTVAEPDQVERCSPSHASQPTKP